MRIAVSRAPGAGRVVTPLELFSDLVYVFAIGQLSHHLLEHGPLVERGGLQPPEARLPLLQIRLERHLLRG